MLLLALVFSSSVIAEIDKTLFLQVSFKLKCVHMLISDANPIHRSPFQKELRAFWEVFVRQYYFNFFSREHLSLWCENPMEKTEPMDILLAAYQRDTFCPFQEEFKLETTPAFFNLGIKNVKSFKAHPQYKSLLSDIQTGKMKFHFDKNPLAHPEYVNLFLGKYVVRYVERELLHKLEQQTGERLTIKELFKKYESVFIPSNVNGLNYVSVVSVFLRLPEIVFYVKGTQLYGRSNQN